MKTLRTFPCTVLALTLGWVGLAAAPAPAQTVITSAPYTITTSGRYVLGGNLSVGALNTPAIKITVPNVVLDLNGYYVAGPGDPAAGTTVDNCVIQVRNVPNVTIKNGTVSSHAIGIIFMGAPQEQLRNHVAEKVVVTRCYGVGIYSYGPSSGSVIKRCSFTTIGNSTNAAVTLPAAIYTDGGFRIQKNNVSGVEATGFSLGIRGNASDFIVGNTIADCKIGIQGGKCLNNLTDNVATPFDSTTNATGNN